jgi:hypothetical protein
MEIRLNDADRTKGFTACIDGVGVERRGVQGTEWRLWTVVFLRLAWTFFSPDTYGVHTTSTVSETQREKRHEGTPGQKRSAPLDVAGISNLTHAGKSFR